MKPPRSVGQGDPVALGSAGAEDAPTAHLERDADDAPWVHPAIDEIFGDRRGLADRFRDQLADTGVSHGLIGPREVPRLWSRHLLNCAAIAPAFAPNTDVIDLGSGAGLPGIVLAIARPDLSVTLVEPMQRRTSWLVDVVADLDLDNVTIRRGRAEEVTDLKSGYVTARAVAEIAKLARWSLPLLAPGGTLVALKGRSAAEELVKASPALRRMPVAQAELASYGCPPLPSPVTAILIRRR